MWGCGPSPSAVALRKRCQWLWWDWPHASCHWSVLCMGYCCHLTPGLSVCPAHSAPVLVIKTLLLQWRALCHGSSDREEKNKATFITVRVSACRFSYDADRFEDIPVGMQCTNILGYLAFFSHTHTRIQFCALAKNLWAISFRIWPQGFCWNCLFQAAFSIVKYPFSVGQILKDLQLPLNGKSLKEQMNGDGLSAQIDEKRIMEDVND